MCAAARCRVEDDGLPCDGVHYAVFSLWKGATGHTNGMLGTLRQVNFCCAAVLKRPPAQTCLADAFLQGSLAA
jgi:hypothetical protein